jgi:hypothetical protein
MRLKLCVLVVMVTKIRQHTTTARSALKACIFTLSLHKTSSFRDRKKLFVLACVRGNMQHARSTDMNMQYAVPNLIAASFFCEGRAQYRLGA